MALTKQYLSTNKELIHTQSLVLRQSEQGLTLKATLLNPDGSPYDLSGGKVVVFNEHKENDKFVVDTHVTIVDAAHGEIEYKLHSQCYAATGQAWFEIQTKDGTVVDSTQNFNMNVLDAANASIYNSNYISKLDDLRDQMQSLVDGADGKLKDELQKAQSDLSDKLDAMQTAYNTLTQQLQSTFDDAEKSRKDTYTSDKQSRDNDWTTDKSNYDKAAKDERDAIQKAADKQNSDNQTAWNTEKQQLIDDWNTTQQGFNTTLDGLKTTVANLQSTLNTLNNTDLPNANTKMNDLKQQIQQAESQFSSVDFSQYVKNTDFDAYKTQVSNAIANAGKLKTVSLNGGTPISPDANGNADLAVPKPDLSKYATTDSLAMVKSTADSAQTAANAAKSEADTNSTQITAINTKVNNFPEFKTFTSLSDAQAYNASHPNSFCIVGS